MKQCQVKTSIEVVVKITPALDQNEEIKEWKIDR